MKKITITLLILLLNCSTKDKFSITPMSIEINSENEYIDQFYEVDNVNNDTLTINQEILKYSEKEILKKIKNKSYNYKQQFYEKNIFINCNDPRKILDAIYEDDFSKIEGCDKYHFARIDYAKEKTINDTILCSRIYYNFYFKKEKIDTLLFYKNKFIPYIPTKIKKQNTL